MSRCSRWRVQDLHSDRRDICPVGVSRCSSWRVRGLHSDRRGICPVGVGGVYVQMQ